MRRCWTIGHSTRSVDDLLRLLADHGVHLIADVRRYPRSRRYPHFNTEALAETLPRHGIAYRHVPDLGGRRSPRADSPNNGWRNPGFRGYADYMQTEAFQSALRDFECSARAMPAALLCAEAVPWRCHRSLIADALTIRGWEVRHILTPAKADRHVLTAFARITERGLQYPADPDSEQSALF
jgi:uncharacterized protein (DUF488 family)